MTYRKKNGFPSLAAGKTPEDALVRAMGDLEAGAIPEHVRLQGTMDIDCEIAGASEAGSVPVGVAPHSNSNERKAIPVHFEKTVEWAFVKRCLPDFAYGAPLAGDHEPWGDAMMNLANCWLLIEFKGEENDIKPGEFKKYPKNNEARKAALKKLEVSDSDIEAAEDKYDELQVMTDAPHILVYGLREETGTQMKLLSRRYWSWPKDKDEAKKDEIPLNTETWKSIGRDYRAFEKYALDVVIAKAGKWRTRGSGTHAGVLGLYQGSPVVVMQVSEFLEGAGLLVDTLTADQAEKYISKPPSVPHGPKY